MRKPNPKQQEPIEIFECEQGSEEWFQLRIGVPSSSNFAAIMANGREGADSKMRTKLLHQMAGEILCGQPAETYTNQAMERGKLMEARAREHYAFTRQVELTRVGFVRRTVQTGGESIVIGCSPDALVGDDGVLEIKTMAPHLLIDVALRGTPPPEHRAQTQGIMLVTGRAWCDLVIYYTGMPVTPTFRIVRDDTYIEQLKQAIEVFCWDLKNLVAKIRKMGGQK